MTSGISPTSTTSGYSSGSTSNSSSTSEATTSKLEFLQLLTLQLKSQNPTKPYDNQEFASQLAQFSQLEQLTDIKSLIEEQVSAYQTFSQTMTNSALPGMLGKSATAKMSSMTYDGESSVNLSYDLASAASSGTLSIKNSSGTVVKTIDLTGNEVSSGSHSLVWDGKDNDGNTVAAGDYTVSVKAISSTGSTVNSDTYLKGTIQAVRYTTEGTKLVINGTEVALSDVSDISAG